MTRKVFMKVSKSGKDESPLVQMLRSVVTREAEESGEKADDVYYAIASTPSLDRDDEVLIPRGVQIREFMDNPVMLHIHNYRQVSVGKAIKLAVSDDEVGFAFKFADTEDGREMRYLYDEEFMSAFSVGFIPRAYVRVDDETPDKIDIDVNDGEKFTLHEVNSLSPVGEHRSTELGCIETAKQEDGTYKQIDEPVSKYHLDLSQYERRPRNVIARWELLEVSPVPVPSNPDALLVRAIQKAYGAYDDPRKRAVAAQIIQDEMGPIIKQMTEFLERDVVKLDDKTIVRSHTTPIDNESAWNGDQARASLARWASSDGSGSKETMNWGKFSTGYGWFDGNSVDNFTSYKLPHHVIRDNQLVGVWRGITAAMGALLGARGGVDVQGQEQGVYNHLARHYRDNDREAPPFNRDYSEEEVKGISEDVLHWNSELEKFEDADDKEVRTTGASEGHTHTYEDTREGRTSTDNGHWHPVVTGQARTGPPNGEEEGHTHTLPNPVRNEDGTEEKDVKEELSGLQARLDELEASLGIRLGVISDMIEEISDAIQASGNTGDSAGGSAAGSDGGGAGGSADEGQKSEEAEAFQRGAERLVKLLGGQND